MTTNNAVNLIRRMPDDAHLYALAAWLADWLVKEATGLETSKSPFSESRARALLHGSDLIDDATRHDFERLTEYGPAARIILYDLLVEGDLVTNQEVVARAMLTPTSDPIVVPWLTLIMATFARKSEYPLHQLDPASLPATYSPAGQVLRQTVHFIRQQIQRTATDKDKLIRHLSLPPSGSPSLEELMPDGQNIAPLPPHFRPPIPERYPEVARETLRVDPDEAISTSPITIGEPLVITEDEVKNGSSTATTDEPERMPPLTIRPDQVSEGSRRPPSPMPEAAVVVPSSTTQPRPNFTMALRQMLGQEELATTKLRVIVQQYPDGPGFYGLQVRVRCKGVKSYVAGTTNRQGLFVCELPVRMHSGLTYDTEVTWPRDLGGDLEQKSITLNADRTQFDLPFYRQSAPAEETV